MDPAIILFLILTVPCLALSGYLGWIDRARNPWRYKAQAAFLVTAVMGVPFLAGVLALQAGAEKRLVELGILLHPEARHVVGVAMGLGAEPVWLFRMRGDTGMGIDF